MKLSKLEIRILETLYEANKPLSLKDISSRIKLRINPRTVLNEINKLIKNNRIEKEGNTNSAKYFLDDIIRYYKKFEYLYVFKKDEIAGYFIKMENSFRFIYSTEFLISLNEPIATISLTSGVTDFKEIPAIFEENIPEGINREILEINTKISDEFELLLTLEDNIGDLRFSKTTDLVHSQLKKGQTYLSLLDEILAKNKKIELLEGFKIDIEEQILFPENYDISKLQIKKSDGISGFQYKKLVHINFEDKVIRAEGNNSKNYILKPYSKLKADPKNEHYFPHISVNEHLFMSFAKNELDFRVPYSAIIKRDGDEEYHYIVKRFDRYNTYKFNKATFAPFLGLTSEKKYDTSSEKLFKRIALELKNSKERMELLKHYVYSVIIVHEDMHTKNLSLIFEKEKVFFAPLYDIACTGIYDTSKAYDSHISINGKQSNIRPNDFKILCKILDIKFTDFKSEAKKIALKYAQKLPEYFDELDKLENINFYKSKIRKKVGQEATWIRANTPLSFVEVLRKFHKKQILRLKELSPSLPSKLTIHLI